MEDREERLENVVSVDRPGMLEAGGATPPRYPATPAALYNAARLDTALELLGVVTPLMPGVTDSLLEPDSQGEDTLG